MIKNKLKRQEYRRNGYIRGKLLCNNREGLNNNDEEDICTSVLENNADLKYYRLVFLTTSSNTLKQFVLIFILNRSSRVHILKPHVLIYEQVFPMMMMVSI